MYMVKQGCGCWGPCWFPKDAVWLEESGLPLHGAPGWSILLSEIRTGQNCISYRFDCLKTMLLLLFLFEQINRLLRRKRRRKRKAKRYYLIP